MGLADLHMHTIYSYDGTATVPAVLKRAKQVGLDLIAITDHDEIRGALLAEQLASQFGIQVIPGVEITTAEGDLLALNLRKLVPAGLPLIETIQRVGELGGFCLAPHPMATGMAMKSLSAFSIRRALLQPDTAQILLGIETYNATALDREGNHAAKILADRLGVAQTGSSDAHVLDAIGLGATIFPGQTMDALIAALWIGTTQVQKGPEWGAVRVLSKWAANYVLSTPARLLPALAQ
ncbi:MAG: PHP domain-containing protein [Chloroflexi bacterium]|nr:PHP domain-containing protein [Chloroflexota bacterium]